MKHLVIVLIMSSLVSSRAHPQQWMSGWLSQLADKDSIVSSLTAEFQKAIGYKAPTFSYRRLDDSTLHVLFEDTGHVVLVNLWATDCSGCKYEMPDLSRLQEVYGGSGLRVIFLSLEAMERLAGFFALHKTAGIKGTIDRNQLERPYQLVVKPSSFIVDKSGIVRETWIGPKVYEDIARRIQLYLDRNE